jgi:Ni/Co efflux regulator RcnB
MHARKILSSLVALSLAASGAAFGQGNPRPQDEPGYQNGQNGRAPDRAAQRGQAPDRAVQRGQPDQRGDRSYRGDQRANYRGDQRDSYRGPEGRGAGPEHQWVRGGRLPPEYRGRQYVVDDWRGHHLSAPPRGYHWVQAGGDYVLAAIATGVIASILLNQ